MCNAETVFFEYNVGGHKLIGGMLDLIESARLDILFIELSDSLDRVQLHQIIRLISLLWAIANNQLRFE